MIKIVRKKGFTIVKLVIVIAVIAILAAILIPTFANVVDNANTAKIQSELKSAYTQYVTEASDDKEYVEGYAHILFEFDDTYYE